MIQKIKTDIEKCLDDSYCYNHFYIRCEIAQLLRQYTESKIIYQYSVVCDDTINIINQKESTYVDVYIKEHNHSPIINLSFHVYGRLSARLRKHRKEKLKSIWNQHQ